jgi:hypothetical protein
VKIRKPLHRKVEEDWTKWSEVKEIRKPSQNTYDIPHALYKFLHCIIQYTKDTSTIFQKLKLAIQGCSTVKISYQGNIITGKYHLYKQHAWEWQTVKTAELALSRAISHIMVKIKAAVSNTPSVSVTRLWCGEWPKFVTHIYIHLHLNGSLKANNDTVDDPRTF